VAFAAPAWADGTAGPATAPADTFCNPVDVLVADPFIFQEGDTYYLYGTASGEGLYVWTSADLVHWRLRGHAYERSADTWGRAHFWAPELFAHNGKYYLHFTAVGPTEGPTEMRRVVLAEGDSPLGPFKEVRAPWFDVDWTVIDSHVFRDGNGDLYLYAVEIGRPGSTSFEIRVRRLDDALEAAAEDTLCLKPAESWEGTVVNEGPFVFKHGDTYLLTFSANGFEDPNYCVGVATAPSPLGPWTKRAEGPILRRREGVSGPGHHCFVSSPDRAELFIAYHTHQQPRHAGHQRQLAIDRVRIVTDDGATVPTIEVDGPTLGPIALPSGAGRVVRGQNEEFDGADLDRRRWLVFNEEPTHWSITDGRLVVRTQNGDAHELRSDLRNLFLQYPPSGDFDVTTRVSVSPGRDYEQAALYLWQDHNHFVKLAVVHAGGVRVEVADEIDGRYVSGGRELPVGPETWLRIRRRGDRHEFLVGGDGTDWTSLGTRHAALRDLRVGIGAAAPVSGRAIPAAFDFLRFETPKATR
jgi:beta-xylosidase